MSGTPQVTLEHAGGATWRATYRLRTPASELRFVRPASGFRADAFAVETPGYSFRRDGDFEVLRTEGKPASVIRVRFSEQTAELPKEYEFFQKFTDGSVAIYSGHLLADAGDEKVRSFRLVPPPGQSVIVSGRRSTRPVEWNDEADEGTYVYFGSIPPVETAHAILVVDPGLPDWLQQRARDALPRLFELYVRRLGAELRSRPTVLFSYTASDASGFHSGGGTLTNLIQLSVEGRAWERESRYGFEHLFHFLAHEAAHLWNGQIAHYPGSEHAWMHEGGADALAERALADLGVITEARFLEYQTAALNECRRTANSGPLREAARRGEYGLYYSCGNVIALITDAAIDEDLYEFWKALIRRTVAKTKATYDFDDYLAVWRELGASADDVAALQSIVNDPANPETFVGALRSRDVRVSASEAVPQEYGQALSRAALSHLLRDNCNGSHGFRSTAAGFVLDGSLNCRGFTSGAAITAIGGHDALRSGHRVWDSLYAACGNDGSIAVMIDRKQTTVRCSERVPARPAFLRIDAVP